MLPMTIRLICVWVVAVLCAGGQEWSSVGFAPVEVKASSTQAMSAVTVINGGGLAESEPESDVWVHGNSPYESGGAIWNSGYDDPNGRGKAVLEFDLGEVLPVTAMQLWNGNEKGRTNRSAKEVELWVSADGKEWEMDTDAVLKQASGNPDERAQNVPMKGAKARFVKLVVKSNYHGGEPVAVSEVRFISPDRKMVRERFVKRYEPIAAGDPFMGLPFAKDGEVAYPKDSGVVNLREAPYFAKGDGVTDDTRAIQKALDEHPNSGAILYLPHGIYLVSDTLRWPDAPEGRGGWEFKNVRLQGQSRMGTVVLLKDGAKGFGNPREPKGLVWTGPAPAQRFSNEIRDLTLHTGTGNPGASGAQFHANNQGHMMDVFIVSGDGRGVAGIDMRFSDEIGPLLLKNIAVVGFDYGVWTGGLINSQTIEGLYVADQNKAGVRSDGQTLSVRKMISRNAVPALVNKGFLTLLDSEYHGKDGAVAIVQQGDMLARNVKVSGYREGLGDGVSGEFLSGDPSGFGEWERGERLELKDTPVLAPDAVENWVSPLGFGGKPNDDADDTEAIQKAVDSGAKTVYLPRGNWKIAGQVILRGKVARLVGLKADFEYKGAEEGLFVVADGDSEVVLIEGLRGNYEKRPVIEGRTKRTVVVSGCINTGLTFSGGGEVFIEDTCANPQSNFSFTGVKAWARQLNPENEGTHISVNGGSLWVLGLKTERGGTLVEVKNGARVEVWGGFSYTTGAGALAPMFTLDQSSSGLFRFREVCFTDDPFRMIVKRGSDQIDAKDPKWNGRKLSLFEVAASGSTE